jgi:UDP-N-acetylglucosamine--N-acetylmuramyl-(pentapeptide) pyrophosphoryl-undecaprenol N-acetylglucosamine transferase
MKNIFITGGHLTPALAVIEKFDKNKWEILYIGRKYALEGDKVVSVEYTIINQKKIKFLTIFAGRIQRALTKYTLWSIIKIPIGFLQALYYVIKYKPNVILSFGGYVALPVVLAGWLFRIPIYTHEQTMSIGLANKIISKFANKILVSWEKNLSQFPKSKTVLVGLPIRKQIFEINKKFTLPNDKPVIYITGGNLGAHSINVIIEQNLQELLKNYILIHQCGDTNEFRDFERLENIKKELPINLQKQYFIFKYITDEYIGWVMNQADILITRSGANIVVEIIQLQKPAIFIPLPWSGENEQYENAKYLEIHQAAKIILQQDLSTKMLFSNINEILKMEKQIKYNLKNLNQKLIQNAALKIVDVVELEGYK